MVNEEQNALRGNPEKTESLQESNERVARVLTTRAETRAFYNKISKVYDLMAEHSEGPVRQRGLDRLDVQPGETLLEIGCGTGHSTAAMARATGVSGCVIAADLSDGMLHQTGLTLQHEGARASVLLCCADAEKIPLKEQTVDAVFMSFTLELFDTPEIPVVLSECQRVLKPGGRIAVVAVSKEGHHPLLVGAYEWTHRHFPNFLDCRPIFAGRSLEAAGFQVRESEVTMMWVPVEIVWAVKRAG